MLITLLDFASGDVTITDDDGGHVGNMADAAVPFILRNVPGNMTVVQRRAYAPGERRLTVAELLAEYDENGAWGW